MDATAQELIARLRRNPDDADAFASLRAHYQRIGDYASLANLLEGWAGRARDKTAAAQAMFEAGELVLGALADRERAIRMYERGLAIDPRHQDTFLRLRGLFEDSGESRRLADLLERHAQGLTKVGADPRDVALLYHQLGELWEHRFNRVDKAVNHYRNAFEMDGNLVAAIYAAREIYRNAGNLKASATLLEKEAKAEPDQNRRVALWRELAHMRSEQLDDQEGAALALKRALGEAPGDLEVMSDLARVYLARADRSEDEHVSESDRHRAADLLYQMAQQVSVEHALTYLEQALDARPDHDGAMALFERYCEEARQTGRLPSRWVAYLARASDRPEAAYRRKRLAQAYLDAGQVDYAITCLEWLLDEKDPEAAETLVDLYRQTGREDDAINALGVAAQGLPPDKRVPRLRELVQALRDQGDIARAGDFAAQILEVEPNDPEALHLLEESCRQTGVYAPYRDALLAASRASGLGPDERKLRLKQVATISEGKMHDDDGAISAWRGVAALDPSDHDARSALKRLFEQTERWDDLVELLEREALSLTDPETKADVYRQIAIVHRDRREDLAEAIGALRNLRELLPGDDEGRDMLSDALVAAGAYLEAIPLLRARLQQATGSDRAELLRLLATILEEHVDDEDGAFDCWARLLDENPNDLDAVSHMVGIDSRAGRHERLLSTLSYKVEILQGPEERAEVFVQMASIAEDAVGDLERAAELYARALELAPGDGDVLDALCAVYERSDRYKDLVVLLRDSASREEDPHRRAELYRRIARTLSDSVANDEGAAEAYREVLAAGEDEEALRFLRHHAERNDAVEDLEDLLRRLASVVESQDERRDLLHQRALLLADRLERPQDAIEVLREVVELQADHVGALQKLAQLCEATGEIDGLADALWRQLDVVEDPGLRVPVARRLSDLHAQESPDPERCIEALYAWSAADPGDAEPLERLVEPLRGQSRWTDLVAVLDQLATLAPDEARASELTRESAGICYRQLGDVESAWERLTPRILELDDAEAEQALRDLAQAASRGEKLAEFYVSIAQGADDDPDTQARRWMDAAGVYESYLDQTDAALEAVLRAFAVDLSNFTYLDEADRLAQKGDLWERLGQVYETLIRRAETPEVKVELLLRHAERLTDPSQALDQTLRACSLAPMDDDVLVLAEERAHQAGRADELLITYDKRRSQAEDDAGRVEALLRSARLCATSLGDDERGTHYLAQAVALTVRSPDLAEQVEQLAATLDHEAGGATTMRDALVRIYAVLADDMEEDPVGGARLLLRAAHILRAELGNDTEAFAALKKASAYAPSEAEVLDELERFARELSWTDALDEHLAYLVEEALDSRTASQLLQRRGRLLEELDRYQDASEVWSRLSTVTGGAPEARRRLRKALRKAGQFQDLLVALQRDLRNADAVVQKVRLLKEVALVWEEGLENRYEAKDAWQKVLDEAPGDADAVEALARIEEGRRRQDDSDFEIAAPPHDSLEERLDAELGAPAEIGELEGEPVESVESLELADVEEVEEPGSLEGPADTGTLDEELVSEPMETEDVGELVAEAFVDATDDEALTGARTPAEGTPIGDMPSDETPSEPPEEAEEPEPARVDTANHRVPRETRLLEPGEKDARPDPFGPDLTPSGEADALTPSEERPTGDEEELSSEMPMAAEEDFEDDYTAVAEDVFDAIREGSSDDAVGDVLQTAELDLADVLPAAEPEEDRTIDSADQQMPPTMPDVSDEEVIDGSDVLDLDDLSGVEELSDSGLQELEDVEMLDDEDEIEPLDDEIEEISDLEELEELDAGPPSSKPPPPPPTKG